MAIGEIPFISNVNHPSSHPSFAHQHSTVVVAVTCLRLARGDDDGAQAVSPAQIAAAVSDAFDRTAAATATTNNMILGFAPPVCSPSCRLVCQSVCAPESRTVAGTGRISRKHHITTTADLVRTRCRRHDRGSPRMDFTCACLVLSKNPAPYRFEGRTGRPRKEPTTRHDRLHQEIEPY
jgi:hypothetical protein